MPRYTAQCGYYAHWHITVDAIAEGLDANPWGPDALPVPLHFTHEGPPPHITVSAVSGDGAIDTVHGRLIVSFVSPEGTVTTERPPRAQPGQPKPLVTVRSRTDDGLPHVTVTGGEARVRIID